MENKGKTMEDKQNYKYWGGEQKLKEFTHLPGEGC